MLRGKKLSFGLRALAVFTLTLFAASAGAADQETVLHSFGGGTDGKYTDSGLIIDSAGNLYGTTATGGIHDKGTVFELSPRQGGGWAETVLHSFDGTDGQESFASLILDGAGNLYGTTFFGGIHPCAGDGCGTVFELSPREGGGYTETVLHNFNNNGDGFGPHAGLILDAAGNLYGTTSAGGLHSGGTVFELSPREGGGWTETLLHSFEFNGTGGSYPSGSLIFDPNGNLYGTTEYGGIHTSCSFGVDVGCGTVFQLSPRQGGGWIETVLHSFGSPNDGQDPRAALTFDGLGNLYGTTYYGGLHGFGTVFEFSPRQGGGWTEIFLNSFQNGPDGRNPHSALVFDSLGNLYGTTWNGGIHGYGTVFEVLPRGGGGWRETILHSFGYGNDGYNPESTLIFGLDGSLYGTTAGGGIHGYGSVFAITP
jgi:uncharacterized repeat protein (TIGR03803 family)